VLAAAIAITGAVAWFVSARIADTSVPEGLGEWPVVQVRIGDTELTVVEAVDTARGLTGVEGLGQLDGMLFAYPRPQDPGVRRFHMTGVGFPLDALFFDADGRLIEAVAMPVCDAEPCPRYAPARPYRWVVEVSAGSLEAASGDRLELLAEPH
jgi:uncharacterized membrane protein (UPF0127 family)